VQNMGELPDEVRAVIPQDAELVRQTTTRHGTKYAFRHVVNGFIVDGDRVVVRTKPDVPQPEVVDRIWTEDVSAPEDQERQGVAPPPAAPLEGREAKVTRVLIDPDDPFYIWEPNRKPPRRAPCLLVQEKASVRVLDIRGNYLGRGVPPP